MSEPDIQISDDASEMSEAMSVAQEVMGNDWSADDSEGSQESSSSSPSGPGPGEAPPVAGAAPAASPSLTLDQARQRWNQDTMTRSQLREQLDRQFQERQRVEDVANAILRAQQQAQAQQAQLQPQQQPEAPQIDPELQRYFDAQQQSLLQQVQQLMAPVLTQAQQAAQQQEIQQQVSAEQGQWNEFRERVSQAENDYMATPEGQGYNERVGGYEQAMLTALGRSGLDEGSSRKLVNEQLKGFSLLGMALNVPPPVLLDNYINSVVEFAVSYKNGGGNGYARPNGQPVAPGRSPARVSPQVQIARQATLQGAVGAPPNGSSGAANGLTVADLMERSLTGKDIDALVKEHGSLDKAMRFLDRLGMELEQVEG